MARPRTELNRAMMRVALEADVSLRNVEDFRRDHRTHTPERRRLLVAIEKLGLQSFFPASAATEE